MLATNTSVTPTSCEYEVQALRARIETLEAQLALQTAPIRRLEELESCSYEKLEHTNLPELLPSLPGANLKKYDGRCSRRFNRFEAAWAACMKEPACVGVEKDNGLACGGGHRRLNGRGESNPPFVYELRGGGNSQRGPGTAWVCRKRLKKQQATGSLAVHPNAPSGAVSAREGFVFIALGACAQPNYDCLFLREVRDAIAALRARVGAAANRRPVAVISDGAISAPALMEKLQPDLVKVIPQEALSGRLASDSDQRVRKLLAYRHPPFEKNVFFDGDTHVRDAKGACAHSPQVT
jgi:hypothetical protein